MRWLLIISLSAATAASGQAPGYMGKKLLITGEVSFLNALSNPNFNMNYGLREFSFNVRATADLDYVTARNATLGLTFDVFATGMRYKWNAKRYTDPLVPGIEDRFDHARISGYGYGINCKIYRSPSKGSIAPVGRYMKLDVMLLDVRVRPFDKAGEAPHSFSGRFFTPAFSVTFGRQRILWDFLILRSGVQLGFVPLGVSPYLQSLDSGIESATQEQDLRANAKARLFSYYLLNVNFGVGVLLPFRKRYRSAN